MGEPYQPAPEGEVLELVSRLVRLLLAGSDEGTFDCEAIVARVAARHGWKVQVTVLVDAALAAGGDRRLARDRAGEHGDRRGGVPGEVRCAMTGSDSHVSDFTVDDFAAR